VINSETLPVKCVGGEIILISTSPFFRSGGRVGFSFGVSWGKYGYVGCVLPQREAKKMAEMILDVLSGVSETEEDQYKAFEEKNKAFLAKYLLDKETDWRKNIITVEVKKRNFFQRLFKK